MDEEGRMKHPPTAEQLEILDVLRSSKENFTINALAGTGKTSTLQLIDEALDGQIPILYLAFNKKIVKEAQVEGAFSSACVIKTFNSIGHSIWAQSVGTVTLDKSKTNTLFKEAIKGFSKGDVSQAWGAYSTIFTTVGMAKSVGYIPEGKFPSAKRLIDQDAFLLSLDEELTPFEIGIVDDILIASIKAAFAGGIDFNDQIYMPALFGGPYPNFPLVLVDEAQDLNPTNHEMLKRLAKARCISVGDPWQSIYAFRGAVRGGMGSLREAFNMRDTSLTISFRCPSEIVKSVRWHVPHLKWSKEGGRAAHIQNPTFASLPDDAAIICRNNAPLFKLGLQLLSAKRSVSIAGTEIGPKLLGIMRKLAPEATPRLQLIDLIEEWRCERLARNSSTADDTAECMLVFASYGKTLGEALAYANHIFAQQGTIQLMTGHKAKGLEFDNVFHLDPWLIKTGDQEDNLKYVVSTRSKNMLYEINSKDFK